MSREAQTRPDVEFVFSWEAIDDLDGEYQGFCYEYVCPNCGSQPIEIYVDRILSPIESKAFFNGTDDDKADDNGVTMINWRIHQLLLHELAHWAGCTDDEAYSVEEIAEEFLPVPDYDREPQPVSDSRPCRPVADST